MFWSKKNRKSRKLRLLARRESARWLRFEPLESRQLLAAGIVDVHIAPLLAAGRLDLVGDGSNNDVRISQTANVGEYRIEGRNGTLLQLNSSGVTMPSVTVNGITDDIRVDLGNGDDVFTFDSTSAAASQPSNVPSDLTILNNHGSDRNTLSNVLVNGDLTVTKNAGTTGYSELHILDSTVIGYTRVDNTGGGTGGDTWTEINNSRLQGDVGAFSALALTNGSGCDIVEVLGNSQFGTGPFPGVPILSIVNGEGGSRTTFTGASQVAGFGTTTIYGDLVISNGANIQGTLDIVTFNGTNVLGDVAISNGVGNTSVSVVNSTLGSHLVAPPSTPVIGGPVTIINDAGYDKFEMQTSTVPWGLYIDNDQAAGHTSNWGSATNIVGSHVGTAPFGPSIPGFPGAAFVLLGDNGKDVVDLSNTEFGGTVFMRLFGGNDSATFSSRTSMHALDLVTDAGNDTVVIDDAPIAVAVTIDLGSGADTLLVRNIDPATEWPSALLGLIDLDGGIGVDTTNLSALTLGALAFEVYVT